VTSLLLDCRTLFLSFY